jgi:adenylate kinase
MALDQSKKNIVIFISPIGAGKGTQAKILKENKNWIHVSTGDIFRSNIKEQTELGKEVQSIIDAGNLVPDNLTNQLVFSYLEQMKDEAGFIMDGYPRTLDQAAAFDEFLKVQNWQVNKVIHLNLSEDKIIKRITGRYICANCGEIYNKYYKPTKVEGVCDVCGSKDFKTRADDTEEVVKERLSVYKSQTEPVLGYYSKQGKVAEIDADQSVADVASAIEAAL